MSRSAKGLIGTLAVAGAVVLGAWLLLRSPPPQSAAPADRDDHGNHVVDERSAAELAPAPEPVERILAESAKAPEPAVPPSKEKTASPPHSAHLHGRVLDVRGAAVPAVGVGFRGKPEALTKTDVSGAFELDLELSSRARELVAIGDDWITIRHDVARATDREREHVIIAAPRISLAGRVVDAAARPLASASVDVDLPIEVFAGFPLPLDSTGLELVGTKSGADGSFEMKSAPAVPRGRLLTSFTKLETDTRPLPTESASDITIELKERREKGSFLEGVVVHADGAPAPGARVMLAGSDAESDDQGRFRLSLQRTDPATPLVAVLKGFQAAVIPEYGRVLEATDMHPSPVRLELGPAALTIAGHVLEADGKPGAKWTVSLVEGTAVSQGRIPVITAEKLSLGAAVQCVTADDGAFRLGGLRKMPYRLAAFHQDGRMIQSPPIEAGTQDAVLRAGPDDRIESVSGRVVGTDGTPIAEVWVVVNLVTERTVFGASYFNVKSTTTNADGTFELKAVPRHFTRLDFGSDAIESKSIEIETVDTIRPLEVVVFRICRFRFEGEAAESAPTGLAVLDAEGKSLYLRTLEEGMMSSSVIAPLTDGRSHVLSVSEKAARLVLYRKKDVLTNQPLHLVPDEITVVHREP